MGMYTQLQFNMIIKPEFRKYCDVFLNAGWAESDDLKFKEFGKHKHASFIPTGYNVATDGGSEHYTESTGEWMVDCAFKNYDDTLESFLELIPYFIESINFMKVIEETPAGEIYTEYKFIEGALVEALVEVSS